MTPIEFKDLLGLSDPLSKLICTCAEGIGAVARPWIMERDAKALVAARGVLEDGGLDLTSATLPSLKAEISSRIEYREAKIHHNLQSIVSVARDTLPETVTPEDVESDWVGRFFSYAQDVSSEQMQQIWGRLLSGEVARPGTFSLRTLELVRSLSATEADIFSKLSKFILHGTFCISPDNLLHSFKKKSQEFELGTEGSDWATFYSSKGLSPAEFTLLEEIQLLVSSIGCGSKTWTAQSASKPILIAARGSQAIAFTNPSESGEPWSVTIPVQGLTHIGRQLMSLMEPSEFAPDFMATLAAVAKQQGLICSIATKKVNPETGKLAWWIDNESGSEA